MAPIKDYSAVSLLDFQNQFSDERACWEYLVKVKWPDGIICNQCTNKKHDYIEKRKVFACRVCKRQTSVTAGTIFHKTRTPLRTWFWAIFIMATSKKGVPSLYLQRQLAIKQYRTAWLISHKIRSAMIQREQRYSERLSGIVQIDVLFIGGKQSKQDWFEKGSNKTPFLIAVQENEEGRPRFVRFVKLPEVLEKYIIPAITNIVKPGSLIKGDGENCYVQLPKLGYELRSIPFRKKELAAQNLKWANTLISNLKRFLLSTHHSVNQRLSNMYVHEFSYRFNRRYWPDQAFDRLLHACVFADPLTLPELNT